MRASAVVLLPLCLACATLGASGPPAPSPVPNPRADQDARDAEREALSQLREEAARLLRSQGQAFWRQWVTGEASEASLPDESFFTLNTLEQVRHAALAAAGEKALALRHLEFFIAGELVAQATEELAEEIAVIEADALLALGEDRHPFHDLDRLLANEPSAEVRAQIAAAEIPVVERLLPLLRARQEATENALRGLGYPSPADFGLRLRGSDARTLAALAERTLEATGPLYFQLMDRLARDELGIPLSQLRRSDVPRLFRADRSDGAFPGRKLITVATDTVAGLGLDLTRAGLTLDATGSPQKHPRPLCVPVDPPRDVRLSVKPGGGADEYRAFFHELAHAHHYLHVQRPEWELRALGEGPVHEGLAILFESIVDTPQWLEETTPLRGEARRRFLTRAVVKRLYLVRRHAARLRHEIAVHEGTVVDARAAWRAAASRVLGYSLTSADADRYLLDRDEFFQSADYLRAELLSGQAESHLIVRFGPRWWGAPEAGEVLRSIWSEGSAIDAEGAARRLGAEALTPEAFVESLRRRLDEGDPPAVASRR